MYITSKKYIVPTPEFINRQQTEYKPLTNLKEVSGYGKVFITGFGPGDPELLTIKALKAIEAADIIYFDDLVDQNFLKKFPAERVYVGKRKGKHSHSQDQINEFLFKSAREGKNTVRLKGGDPFIFGRGGEELKYLKERFIEVEIIPGISAAFGAASEMGVPLTLRGISSSVAFCTGFPKNQNKIPIADTIVFYMSASTIQETAISLIKTGIKRDTPVALVKNATLKNQQSIFSNLEEISKGKISLSSPMIAIIGEVARENSYGFLNKMPIGFPEFIKEMEIEPETV